jgi:hypothetical protein
VPTPTNLISAATDACVRALRPYVGCDWRGIKALNLTWSCWDTALHVADDLYFYAVELIHGSLEREHFHTELALDEDASVERLLGSVPVHGELLRRVAVCARPVDRAYHVFGVSDAEGFVAMGAAETLVHTYDIVRGLDGASSWLPPAELATQVLRRLFPAAPEGHPSEVLLYCCGRVPLGESPRLRNWRWDGRVRD